jgi:hypothetical protein
MLTHRMAKQHPRDFSFSQWFFITTPSVVAPLVAWLGRKEMEFPTPLYIAGAGIGLSLLMCFVMVYGEDL